MNTLKPLLIVAVLAGIGYGVYVRINDGNNAPPPGVAEGWDLAPKVQMPESASPGGIAGWGPGGGPSIAPSFGPPRTSGAVAHRGGEAPAYQGAPPDSAAPPFAQGGAPGPGGRGEMAPLAAPARSEQPPAEPARGNPYTYLPPHDPLTAQPPPGGPAQDADPRASERIAAPPQAGSPAAGVKAPAGTFAAELEGAKQALEAGQMAAALRQLSVWHGDPRLTPAEEQQLTQLLDQVAGTVVYSTQHLLEPPYEVQPGERLEDIGERYRVPWQLLAKINGIDNPQNLRGGERLKVVRGPFSAVVSLDKRQLTLLLADGSYAGQFDIGLGRDRPPTEGVYAVSDKVPNPVYHGAQQAISAEDPNNPLGERWIGLGRDIGIHGTNRPENIGRTDLPGSISLNPRDVEDVYDILSVGSKVTIRR